MSSPYRIDYRGTFWFPLAVPLTWEALQRTDRFERWWPWMRDLRLSSEAIDDGTTLDFVIASPLPYRMKVRVGILHAERDKFVEVAVGGDLEGFGRMDLRDDGEGTSVDLTWSVEMQRRSLRVASRVAGPTVRWSHDWAVRVALRGFSEHAAAHARRPIS